MGFMDKVKNAIPETLGDEHIRQINFDYKPENLEDEPDELSNEENGKTKKPKKDSRIKQKSVRTRPEPKKEEPKPTPKRGIETFEIDDDEDDFIDDERKAIKLEDNYSSRSIEEFDFDSEDDESFEIDESDGAEDENDFDPSSFENLDDEDELPGLEGLSNTAETNLLNGDPQESSNEHEDTDTPQTTDDETYSYDEPVPTPVTDEIEENEHIDSGLIIPPRPKETPRMNMDDKTENRIQELLVKARKEADIDELMPVNAFDNVDFPIDSSGYRTGIVDTFLYAARAAVRQYSNQITSLSKIVEESADLLEVSESSRLREAEEHKDMVSKVEFEKVDTERRELEREVENLRSRLGISVEDDSADLIFNVPTVRKVIGKDTSE